MKIGTVIVIGSLDMDGATGREHHPEPEDKGRRAVVVDIELVGLEPETVGMTDEEPFTPVITVRLLPGGKLRELMTYEIASEEDEVLRRAPEPRHEAEALRGPLVGAGRRCAPAAPAREVTEVMKSRNGQGRGGSGSEGVMTPKHPEVKVRLVGEDGNAFFILGRVQEALREADIPRHERDAFMSEATSGDYNHLLATVMRWVEVE